MWPGTPSAALILELKSRMTLAVKFTVSGSEPTLHAPLNPLMVSGDSESGFDASGVQGAFAAGNPGLLKRLRGRRPTSGKAVAQLTSQVTVEQIVCTFDVNKATPSKRSP